MDTRNGQIYAADELGNTHPADRAYMREMGHHPTPVQRATEKVGRNDPCPCGSGHKFKRCCLFGGKTEKAPSVGLEPKSDNATGVSTND